jgi:hypothetical protein
MKTGTRMRHQYLLISLYVIRICNRSWKLTIIASCPGVIRCRDVEVWSSNSGDFEDFRLLRRDTAWPDNYQTILCLKSHGISCKDCCHINSHVWWYSLVCAGPVPFRYTIYTIALFNLVVPTCTVFRETGVVHQIKQRFSYFLLLVVYLLNVFLI